MSNTSLDFFIRTYYVDLPNHFLEEIASLSYFPTAIGGNQSGEVIDVNYRHCYGYNIQPERDESIYNILWHIIDNLLKQYQRDVDMDICIRENKEGYYILKYTEGCFYKQHSDASSRSHRSLSIIIILNDTFEGGEVSFFNDTYSIKPQKNLAIVFPSSFMFPHQVKPILKGTRYSIVTWVV